MTYRLATRFNRNARVVAGREELDDNMLRQFVPSIFAEDAHDSRSDRYVYVPTIDIVNGLRREGWAPFFAVQAQPRCGTRTGHAKHMLRMRRVDDIGEAEAPEVIIVNSHDGSTSYQMFAGILRFVCTNSMIAGDKFEEIRVPHKGAIQDQIIEGAYSVAKDFPRLIDATKEMDGIQLSHAEQLLLGEASLIARYGEDTPPITPEQVIRPRRRDDATGSIWNTFNAIQENVIRGGILGRRQIEGGRTMHRRTRAINGIDQNVTLNRAMWTLAEGMQRLKAA